ncbi:MAG: hypothetical protein Q9207_000948 [Kuettlingeria erythrocarpa]
MRRGLAIFLITLSILVIYLIHSVYTLLTLLVENGSADAIHSAEIPAPNSPLIDNMARYIPKIIHQTYINESVPEHWREAQRSCIDLHEDYEYKMWTDAKSRELIATEYPWFLNTFDNYSQPIQRADAIRYFVLAHFGGIYIDLDDLFQGCNRRLDPLLSYPAWVRRTAPTGISNDAMGSTPQHPFFLTVIESLRAYDKNWRLPYITVMYSTGPLFLSVIWKKYMSSGVNTGDDANGGRVRILMMDEYNRYPWSFFSHHKGSSWHGKDARLIFWMGSHWIMLTLMGFLLAGVVGFGAWWVWNRALLLGQQKRIKKREGGVWERAMAWTNWGSGKGGYELTERHEAKCFNSSPSLPITLRSPLIDAPRSSIPYPTLFPPTPPNYHPPPPPRMPTLASRRTTAEQAAASSAALRGAAVGAAKFGGASLLLAVVGTLVSPLYRNLTIQFKVFLQLSGMTLGGWIEADRRLRGYEFWRLMEQRRARDEAVWREWERRIGEGPRTVEKKD